MGGMVAASKGRKVAYSEPPMNLRSEDLRLKVVLPNQALQRTGTHKVLGRGRPSAESARALSRPRAEAFTAGLGSA